MPCCGAPYHGRTDYTLKSNSDSHEQAIKHIALFA
jgi:hypothetical protein